MDEWQLEMREIRDSVLRLKAHKGDPVVIEELEAQLRILESLYNTAGQLFEAGVEDPELRTDFSATGMGAWNFEERVLLRLRDRDAAGAGTARIVVAGPRARLRGPDPPGRTVSRFEFQPFGDLDEPGHPLGPIDNADTPGGRLRLLIGPKIVGGRYFRVLRGDGDGIFVQGLHNSGRYPGLNWIEVFDLEPPSGLDLGGEWELALAPYLRPLADVVPAGGHLMIEYEKPLWRVTQLGLLAGIPPIATPMGELLHELGAGSSFKDWYFPEGGQEGGRKLQGNRALSGEHAKQNAAARLAEVRAFLDGPARGEEPIAARARKAAGRLVEKLA